MKTVLTVLFCITLVVLVIFWREKHLSSGTTQVSTSTTAPIEASPVVTPPQIPPPLTASGTAASGKAPASLRSLPNGTWERGGNGPAFSRFVEWTHRYGTAVGAREKSALEAEGVTLARERRDALAELIQANPKEALELTVPLAVRLALPKSVEPLLEERVSGRGDLMVLGALPLPGREGDIKPTARLANTGGKSYDAYTYGWRLEQKISTPNVPIIGIAAPTKNGHAVLALSAEFVRLAEPEEAAAAR